MNKIMKLVRSKYFITLICILLIVIVWEVCAGVVEQTKRTPENILPHLSGIAHSVPTPAAYGIDKQAFFADVPKMAADALASGSPANTRRTVTVQDMETIYCSLYV